MSSKNQNHNGGFDNTEQADPFPLLKQKFSGLRRRLRKRFFNQGIFAVFQTSLA
ncbi:hypothetical protein Q757_00600 [Oenococcus alcoholitolerans]|uniref:Uncharacterized protein n=1 Tax=Oenococcus alcoholitolerans TaxID=931074 RepID=A0ABR4XTU5_9LACO|nr:hypothetical protein Q757_00600 [Oenococcus alcoholitolerans]